jgi:hypothetical protein
MFELATESTVRFVIAIAKLPVIHFRIVYELALWRGTAGTAVKEDNQRHRANDCQRISYSCFHRLSPRIVTVKAIGRKSMRVLPLRLSTASRSFAGGGFAFLGKLLVEKVPMRGLGFDHYLDPSELSWTRSGGNIPGLARVGLLFRCPSSARSHINRVRAVAGRAEVNRTVWLGC